MEIKEQLTKENFWKGDGNGQAKNNKFIVIHYVGAVSTARNNANYFENEYRGASANYFIDENDIYRIVKDEDSAWHCGSDKYFNEARNTNSIGIEMCCFNNNGRLDISSNVIERTIELTKELMTKYNIPVENVVRHYDVTRKVCPAPFIKDETRWNDFKQKLGQANKECDQILRVGSIIRIDRLLRVTGVDAVNNLIAIEELTGTPEADYHWFDPTPFDEVDENGNKCGDQVCQVGSLVKLNGEYEVKDLVKTENWACKLHIGNRDNWVWTEPCYEIKD